MIQEADVLSRLIGQSPPIRELVHLIRLVAPTPLTVLIRGERGTGKELVADALHALSPRRDRPYLKLNCAALPTELLLTELFGHERGAFTGAHRKRVGLVAAAHRGTLFLDEIGHLAAPAQAALLRFLQYGEVRPLGATRTHRVDVRILAATNRNLEADMTTGHFLWDLHDRLNQITLVVSALRDRREDIPLLARHVLQRASDELRIPAPPLTPEDLQWLLVQPWPGNVRQLADVLRLALVLGEGGQLALPPQGPPSVPAPASWLPLSARQHAALTHIQAHGQVSVGELARQRAVSPEAIRRDLTALVELGILRKVGTTRGATFRLTLPWETLLSPTSRPLLEQLFPGVSPGAVSEPSS